MKFYTSWLNKNKKWNKFFLKLRIGAVSVFDFFYDGSGKMFGLTIFNFSIRHKWKR